MKREPYTLVVGSHKGGTGRTTAALALAWCWGQAGRRVVLADADPVGSARLVAVGRTGACDWPNVRCVAGLPAPGERWPDCDLVVVDSPALLGAAAGPVLERADGLVLTCLADPLSLRTVPAASAAIEAARAKNPRLELLGMLIGVYDAGDTLQRAMMTRLRQTHAGLLLEPPVPRQLEVRDWPFAPGAGLPAGPAADAFREVARALEASMRAATAA